MSSKPDELAKVKRLLVLKQYEQPPPGYFDNFPDRVIARLEAEELVEYSSLWRWLVGKFDAKPVVACLYGMFVSGLLLAGFRLSQLFDEDARATAALPWLATTPASGAVLPNELGGNVWIDSLPAASSISVSASPLLRSETPSLLFGSPSLRLQPVSFAVGQ